VEDAVGSRLARSFLEQAVRVRAPTEDTVLMTSLERAQSTLCGTDQNNDPQNVRMQSDHSYDFEVKNRPGSHSPTSIKRPPLALWKVAA